MRSRSPGDLLLVAEAGVLVIWACVRSRRPTPRLLIDARERAPLASSDQPPVDRVVAALDRAAQWVPFPASCLPRALALRSMLRRRGICATLRIGVRREAGRLDGHAWIECAGRVVGDSADHCGRYQLLESAVERT